MGTANPAVGLSQEQSFHATGYKGERIRRIFPNSDIVIIFTWKTPQIARKALNQLNLTYLRDAMKTSCQAILDCVNSARTTVQDVDFLAIYTCTGYVRPDVGRRLIAHMRFRYNLQRASFVGLGCAGAFRHCSGHITDARASSGLMGHYVVAPKA